MFGFICGLALGSSSKSGEPLTEEEEQERVEVEKIDEEVTGALLKVAFFVVVFGMFVMPILSDLGVTDFRTSHSLANYVASLADNTAGESWSAK